MTFSITDLDGFSDTIRDGAAKSLSQDYSDDINDYITIEQVKQIISQNILGVDDVGDYMITEQLFDTIFETVRDEIYQSALSKLAAKNIIECAWDTENQTMIFWLNSKNASIPINSKSNYDAE